MPRPRPPSRVDTITFPVFGISWWASHEDASSIVAFGGGGGGAATGVNNKIVVRDANDDDPREISTGNQVCVALVVYQNPISKTKWLLGAVGKKVLRYSLPSCQPQDSVEAEGCNAVAVNAMADRLAVGCESGQVCLFEMGDTGFGAKLWTTNKHVKAVCSVSFAVRGGSLVSSAKDGTAKVYKVSDGSELATLTCHVQDPNAPPPPRPPQVLVRGCAFGDLEGKVIYTVASARRGKAFLSCWVHSGKQGGYECRQREECSPVPISAMSLSVDGGLMALGGVDGTITLMDMQHWKVLKRFPEVHELPVTCVAARPFSLPLRGEEDGIMIHAISASADSQMPFLTLQRRVPKSNAESVGDWFWTLLWLTFLFLSLYFIILETREQCVIEIASLDLKSLRGCVLHAVLFAPDTRPGILVPPH